MTRLGFVGVGKHAQRMAQAFRECGAEIVAYDRNRLGPDWNPPMPLPLDGFGMRMAWREMVESPGVDAIVCCAPPEVTRAVALECASGRKRLVATKPLMVNWDTSQPLGASEDRDIYVDLWRLYSPAWLALKADLQGRKVQSIFINFCGYGPIRSTHSGLLDWGPHALAFLLDLGIAAELEWKCTEDGDAGKTKLWRATGTGDTAIVIYTGNRLGCCADGPKQVAVEAADGDTFTWQENDDSHFYVEELECSRDLALREFCRAFLRGDPSDTLRISCEAMRMLAQAGPDGRLVTQ